MKRLLAAAFVLVSLTTSLAASDGGVSGSAVIREMNIARQNPALYASYAEELRAHYDGRSLVLPGGTRIFTKEGLSARGRRSDPFPAFGGADSTVSCSPGMCRGAADHCADQASGGFSHNGKDGSNPAARMSRYGNWGSSWGENIGYGKTSARDIVLALIIDDGLPARKHRKNIFAAKFNYAGAAYGHHARFGSVCSIDFAGTYAERGSQDQLVAKY